MRKKKPRKVDWRQDKRIIKECRRGGPLVLPARLNCDLFDLFDSDDF
jgi:hypothetical protein